MLRARTETSHERAEGGLIGFNPRAALRRSRLAFVAVLSGKVTQRTVSRRGRETIGASAIVETFQKGITVISRQVNAESVTSIALTAVRALNRSNVASTV